MTKFFVMLAVCLSVSATVFAGEELPAQVWKQYLSPAEQRTLTAFGSMPTEPLPADATPEQLLAGARQGFEKMILEYGPALSRQTPEPYSKDGVSGLWIRPREQEGRRVLLYFHGGGYILGSAATGAPVAGYLAEEAEISAFVLDYPLAPESPHPAQLDNAEAAYRMLLADGYRPEDIVVAGDSAGGNLTLALLLRLREKALPLPAGAYMISPWGDLGHSLPTQTLKRSVDTVLSDELMEWSASSYTAGQDRKNPNISPIHADPRGFPPLLIQVGTFETLLDDSLTVARNAALADVPLRLSVWPGYSHDFQLFFANLEGARKALDEAAGFLEETLDGTLLSDD